MSAFHHELVAKLQYFEGHSDTLGLFAGHGFLSRAAAAVAEPFREAAVQKVAGIEARGFVLASSTTGRRPGAKPTARRLVEACGGVYSGLSLLVDQLPDAVREELQPVAAVALADELRG